MKKNFKSFFSFFSKNWKATIVVALLVVFTTWGYLLEKESNPIRTDIRVSAKHSSLLLNKVELSNSDEALKIFNNIVVEEKVDGYWQPVELKGYDLQVVDGYAIYAPEGTLAFDFYFGYEGVITVNVNDSDLEKTVSVSFAVTYAVTEETVNTPSTDGVHGLNLYTGPVHTSEDRSIGGVKAEEATVDGESMVDFSGSNAADEIWVSTEGHTIDSEGNYFAESQLPQVNTSEEVQLPVAPTPEVETEAQPEVEPTPSVKPEDGVIIEEGTIVVPEVQQPSLEETTPTPEVEEQAEEAVPSAPEVEAAQPQFMPAEQLKHVCVVTDTATAEVCEAEYWLQNGSEDLFVTFEELGNLIPLGNGFFESHYGILQPQQ